MNLDKPKANLFIYASHLFDSLINFRIDVIKIIILITIEIK